MAIETEFKFKIAAAQKRAVMRALDLPHAVSADYETTYFDTEALDLKSRGMQLRLRRSDEGMVQTFKSKTAEAGPFGREEREIAVDDGELNVRHFREHLPRDLRKQSRDWVLKPQFKTRFRRRRADIGSDGLIAEHCFDDGEIIADGERTPICEFEIELKKGPLAAYTGTCLAFLDKVPSTIQLEGKVARGFRLAQNVLPEPVKGIKGSLDGDMALDDAILLLLRRHFSHFLDNHPAVITSGISGSVHQMRVGMRRFRATLQSFRPVIDNDSARSLLGEMRTIFTELGAVREADVFLEIGLPALDKAGLGAPLVKVLRQEVERFRAKRYRAVRSHLTDAAFSRLVVRLNEWIDGGGWRARARPLDQLYGHRLVHEFAVRRIDKLQNRLFKKVRRARSGTLDDWHDARIAAKKLRYASAPLASAYLDEDAAASYAARLEEVQDALGQLNDFGTIPDFLAQLRGGVRAANAKRFDAATEFSRGWSAACVPPVIERSDELMRDFEQLAAKIETKGAR